MSIDKKKIGKILKVTANWHRSHFLGIEYDCKKEKRGFRF